MKSCRLYNKAILRELPLSLQRFCTNILGLRSHTANPSHGVLIPELHLFLSPACVCQEMNTTCVSSCLWAWKWSSKQKNICWINSCQAGTCLFTVNEGQKASFKWLNNLMQSQRLSYCPLEALILPSQSCFSRPEEVRLRRRSLSNLSDMIICGCCHFAYM